MWSLIKSFSSPLTSLIFMMAASGLFNTYVSLRLELEGANTFEIGLVVAASYLGILLGSLFLERFIVRTGHVKAFVVFAALMTSVVLAQAIWVHSLYWSTLRLIGGICMAGVFIVIESWLLIQSGKEQRGAILSIYLAVFYAALSVGQLLIDTADPRSNTPFLLTASFLVLSILPMILTKPQQPTFDKATERLSLAALFRLSPYGFLGSVISGILLASIYGLAPLFAKSSEMNISQIGYFMASLICGGFILQWPFGKLADKGNRKQVLVLASFLTAGTCLLFSFSVPTPVLYLFAFLFGGVSFTIYPLSMAYAAERATDEQIVAVTGGFVLAYSIGAILGPLLAPLVMLSLGKVGLFYFLAVLTTFLGVVGLKPTRAATIDE